MRNEHLNADLFAVLTRLALNHGSQSAEKPRRPAHTAKPALRQPRLEIAHVALRRNHDRPLRAVP